MILQIKVSSSKTQFTQLTALVIYDSNLWLTNNKSIEIMEEWKYCK